jgi:OmcA/MtrC family decaheme c-type cytochrome
VAGQIGSRSFPLEAQNLFLDFVPAGGDVIETRNIEVVDSCNECHGRLVMHGRRFITEYCVNCHNPDLAEGEGDMKYMIHKIHSAQKFDVLDDGVDFSEVTFPQDIRNCRKCHDGEDEATPDGDNWKNVPNMVACGSCHPDVDFATGANHEGGAQADNSGCASCHPPTGGLAGIEDSHLTDNATPNNQSVASDLSNLSYEIAEARVDAATNVLQIDLSILRDGTPLDLLNLPADLTRSPSFLFGYAGGPQDGIANPNDYNNLGRTAGQPESASLVDLIDGGSVAASGTEGLFTVTVPDAFPVGATMRVVALQSRFRQMVGEEEIDRRTVSVVRPVTDDVERRVVIDPAKCGNCHEWLQLHGGSRVIGAASDPMQPPVCVICHNPNLSSSGRTANPDEPLQEETVAALGEDPLIYPERTQHFKNLIHGIHASARRTEDFEFVRNRLNGIYYNWSEVTFPGVLNDCLTCHVEGTYELPLPADVLMSTEWTTTVDPAEDRDTVLGARDNVPNGTDLVNTPTAATCYMCHDSAEAVAHMELNGGQINVFLRAGPVVGADFVGVGANDLTRDEVLASGTTETCAICHGEGRIADLNVVHGIE